MQTQKKKKKDLTILAISIRASHSHRIGPDCCAFSFAPTLQMGHNPTIDNNNNKTIINI